MVGLGHSWQHPAGSSSPPARSSGRAQLAERGLKSWLCVQASTPPLLPSQLRPVKLGTANFPTKRSPSRPLSPSCSDDNAEVSITLTQPSFPSASPALQAEQSAIPMQMSPRRGAAISRGTQAAISSRTHGSGKRSPPLLEISHRRSNAVQILQV